MSRKNISLTEYFVGIPSDTIRNMRAELAAWLDDSGWEPTDEDGEPLSERRAAKVIDGFIQLEKALAELAPDKV